MDSTMLDGNAVAGMLAEIFAVEMTTALATCSGCGASEPIGAVRVFLGAGPVLRCPHCDTVLAKITRSDTRTWITLPGVRALELGR